MPMLTSFPTIIDAAGNKPERTEEYVGRIDSSNADVRDPGGAEYVGICVPAFSPSTVQRDR
jgi:hypothetical protein